MKMRKDMNTSYLLSYDSFLDLSLECICIFIGFLLLISQAIIVKGVRIGIEIAGKFFGSRCLEL